jgi:hypothetical protein
MTHATSQLLQRMMSKPTIQKKMIVQKPIAAEASVLGERFSNLWRSYLENTIPDHEFLVQVSKIREDLTKERKSLAVIVSDEFQREQQLSSSAVGVLRVLQNSPMQSTLIDSVRLLVMGLVKAEEAINTKQIVSSTDQVRKSMSHFSSKY